MNFYSCPLELESRVTLLKDSKVVVQLTKMVSQVDEKGNVVVLAAAIIFAVHSFTL